MSKTVLRFKWNLFSYCLMGNHYHLLVMTSVANISDGMQFLNGEYCQRFNSVRNRVGHLLQGRYESELVKTDEYFMELLRYIALNPVAGHFVKEPEQYEWSSHQALSGIVPVPEYLDAPFVLDLFSKDHARAIEAYRHHVNEGIEESITRRELRDTTLAELFKTADNNKRRNLAIMTAYAECGYSMSQIANYLKMTCSGVSRIIMRCSEGV